jgi:sugar/nucleoside kinase (ribokinase family)
MTTLAPHRVRVMTQVDGSACLVNAESYQPVKADEPLESVEAAERYAKARGWHVVNLRPVDWEAA